MKPKSRKIILPLTIFLGIVLLTAGLFLLDHYHLLPKKSYTAEDFGITPLHSPMDFNHNGTDDYTDFLLGAKKDAQNHPKYDDAYHAGGFPPDNIGVCTDVIWRAFKNAGYNLREMVNNDIIARPEAYPGVPRRDKNIDFRRVRNLHIFFEEHAVSLTIDITEIKEWQAGDIVIFENDKHIGMVSDKRNRDGQPYIIHNGGQPNREEDYLSRATVTKHYRFDASALPETVLIKWTDETVG